MTTSRATVVFGASGYIGTHLVPRLAQAGRDVRAVCRKPEVLQARQWEGVDIRAADATRPDSLGPVLADCDVAYYLVHSMAAGRNFGSIDLEAARNFAAAAAQAGVEQIIYLGGLVPDDADSEHIVSRKQTGEVLRQGAVPVTEIRAGIIVGPGSAAFEVMRDLVFHLPVMLTPRWVRAKSPPVALDDLLNYLVEIPGIGEARGGTYDAAGPDNLTYEDMMRVMADVSGRRPPWIIPVPVLTPKLSSYWLRLVTSVPTPVARALIEGLKHDFSADSKPLQDLIPGPLMDFRQSVEAAFAAEQDHQLLSRWTEGAFAMRDHRREHAFYAKRAGASARTAASEQALWQVITGIGGRNRYFAYDWLWRIREVLDWLVGGPGLSYGRRHPTELRLGDRVDSWTVTALEPGRCLTLQLGMKVPGAGVLEFVIDPDEDGCRLSITAYWHPAGVWGLLYWYVLVPAHGILFRAMVKQVVKQAEELDRSPDDQLSPS